jgi:cysteine desulfurase
MPTPDIIYLDHNATTPLLPEVAAAMAECQAAGYGNPSSQHRSGRRARQIIDDAREAIGRILGAKMSGRQPDRVILTSGGTEANNLALCGLAATGANRLMRAAGEAPDGEIVISTIEHPSIVGAAEQLQRLGWPVRRVRVSREGVIDLDDLGRLLDAGHVRLASLMLGNNETGVLQPIEQAASLCQTAGVPLHTDAVQAAGKLPVDFQSLGVSAMTVAPHKFQGPVGIGALIVRHRVPLAPLLFGGFQQESLRPGTESVALAVGFRKALELWEQEAEARLRRLREMRNRLESQLKIGFPGLVVNGAGANRLPHVSNLAFRGQERQALLMALDLAGVACSTGSACASGSSEPSSVLRAMGLDPAIVACSLRFSLGATTTPDDVDEAVQRILNTCDSLARPGRRLAISRS